MKRWHDDYIPVFTVTFYGDCPQYAITVLQDEFSDGTPAYVAFHPEMDGVMAQGATVQEAIDNLKDALDDWNAVAAELGWTNPLPNAHLPRTAGAQSSIVVEWKGSM
jgi:predicted RNase H-like HicB family nuclease